MKKGVDMQNVNMKRYIVLLVGLAVSNSILARENPVFGPIHNAIEAENASRVKEILKDTPKALNAPDNMGYLPLHTAAKVGSAEIARILIDNGANVNQVAQLIPPETVERAERMLERIEEIEKKRDDIVQSIRVHSPIARGQREEHKKPMTPLQVAVMQNNYEVAKVLLKNGANADKAKNDTWVPLNATIINGNTKLCKLLVDNGANVNMKLHNGVTPLHIAARHSNTDIVRELLQKDAKVNIRDSADLTPLHDAVVTAPYSETGTEIVRILLEYNANANAQAKNNITPLHRATMTFSENAETVRILLEYDANINAITKKEGLTPLHIAASRGYVKTVRILLENGANPKAKDKNKRTPLDIAQEKNQTEVVEILKNA